LSLIDAAISLSTSKVIRLIAPNAKIHGIVWITRIKGHTETQVLLLAFGSKIPLALPKKEVCEKAIAMIPNIAWQRRLPALMFYIHHHAIIHGPFETKLYYL